MSHHKRKIKINSSRGEQRVGRDRAAAKSKLTWGSHFTPYKNPDPDGGKPGSAWKFQFYPLERKSRRKRAEHKRIERRILLTRAERQAWKDEE